MKSTLFKRHSNLISPNSHIPLVTFCYLSISSTTNYPFPIMFSTSTISSVGAGGVSFFSQIFDGLSSSPSPFASINPSASSVFLKRLPPQRPICSVKSATEPNGIAVQTEEVLNSDEDYPETTYSIRQARRSADWKAAKAYKESKSIYEGRIEGFNGGGLLIRFYSLLGFLPYPLLSPSHSCREPHKSIQEIARDLTGTQISVKVIEANEESKKLIFSEKEAKWSKFSGQVKVGDVFQARVGSVEDYGAFVHLRFPDGSYHITGLVHVSEVSWDLVQDVRDILNEGDEVQVKVIQLDREKSRITLSIKQLEDDPLLETLDKVIPQDDNLDANVPTVLDSSNIDPLPGLESIFKELLLEDGITGVRIHRQGFEKRVVSQDLQLWLSNAPAVGNQFTLLARAGRQVQEICLTTTLNQEGIKKALNRVLERVP